ncbi:MAG: phenylalanine--tRNA ligase subunit beta [Omnitrophica WOR_2 bacterium RIFOXYB2_FULL_38_16]|nr:MAG: phenylalanine--tRNA ligase subunit beta [Omnitrophica WOR_2 bacterium RIFOXYA12_FULL_38_10]OGX56555.1 MAG: phenylalanine--tRNA ligase subunit beta [Omnitrophica WOR_2 bacterium RIFOXYB2_FULL_38_16]
MKISLNWIKDYVEVKIPPGSLADKLTMAGLEVENVSLVGGDTIFEVEVTPNRPDCLNMIGIAREISAVLNKELALPRTGKLSKVDAVCDIKIEDKKGCLRYIGTVVENISIQQAPKELLKRINSLGLRAINNIVDITNFCLLETGQPLHAFDYDKLAGGRIIVRRAKDGEKIVTIDDIERALDPSILVIADAEKPVAIAGIMGGKETEVTASTRNILLESAYFDPIIVRKASRKLGLSSDSSYRFERGVDYPTVENCSNRALSLILKEAGGKIVKSSDIKVTGRNKAAKEIVIEKEKIDSFLGTDTSVTQCKNIFDKLGFDVKVDKQKVFTIVPPSFRGDIVQEVDIIEEVARIIGYDNLPLSMPSIKVSNISESKEIQLRKKIKQILMAQGCSETVTYTMISQKNLNDSKLSDIEKLNIVNPLSQDQEMMRPSLLPSMLSRVQFNLNRGQKDISLFEAGKIYTNKGEKETLAVIMTGVALRDWRKLKQNNVDFVDIKGIVGKVFSGTGIQDSAVSYKISELPFFAGENAQIFLRGKKIGAVGRICQEVLDAWDIKGASVVFAEVDLESFYSGSFSKKKYFPVIEYPIVTRDISLAIKKDILFDEIRNIVFNDNNDIMHNFNLIEEYLGENLPGKEYKGLVCSCKYQSKTGTLKEEEVTKVHERICQSLIDKIGAIRR